MTDKSKLKIHEGSRPHSDFETAVVNGTQYVRDPEGAWRYADSWIKVPGGRDLTLTERFSPKLVITQPGTREVSEIERVVVSGDEIEKHPDLLGWCLELGYPVQGTGGAIFEVMVPWEAWQDHDRIPGMIYAPELHGSESEQELAGAEREYREADRTLEAAAAKRAEVLRRHSGNMTRQQARQITDLSVGRIQQLIREGVDDLDHMDVLVLAVVESKRPKNAKELHKLAREVGVDETDALVNRRTQILRDRNLIKRKSNGFRLTPEGKEALMASRPGRSILDAGED
jgi:hypothetical protein